ncbi:MAG: coenzyme F430 synthase [Candidatus Methanomethylophilaceae archaeon]|jgi:UDP-N-acetylmuramoylalanine-D-glutamate ligase
MQILILDLTHGGDILSEDLTAKGHRVTCVDVYRIAKKEKIQALKSIGVEVTDIVPDKDYDLLVSPAHCPDSFLNGSTYKKRMTFSQAVNKIIDDDRFRIEITGVKGKTSCCYLLAHILSVAGKSVFLHTSRGQGPWVKGMHRIDKQMSIAPTSLLRLPEYDYDIVIAEVSLGGSGKADISVITNLVEDYGIAKNTRKASDAKADILTDKINIVRKNELDLWKKYGDHIFVTYGGNINGVSKPCIGESLRIKYTYDGQHDVDLNKNYLSLQYLQTIDLVLEICETMKIPLWAVVNGLRSFKGVPGRGEISLHDNIWHIKERNPGISHISIGMTLECLERMNVLNNAIVIVDPVSKKVCDKMDIGSITEVVSKYNIQLFFTDGNGSRPEITDNVTTVVEFIKEGYQ